MRPAFSIQTVFTLMEQLLHPLRRGGVTGESRIGSQQRFRGGLRLGQQPGVAADVRHPQPRQTVLPDAEKVARPPEPQILFRNFEAIRGSGHGLQTTNSPLTRCTCRFT